MLLNRARLVLRDFTEADRTAFLAYQLDPRYLALYDYDACDVARAANLFDRFAAWRDAVPRVHFQLGIFDKRTGALCGSAGLRDVAGGTATLGIELVPAKWGSFALALDVAATLIDFGFSERCLDSIRGNTASGNRRVAKLARWLGATIVAERDGPRWMADRGWHEVDWAIDRTAWIIARTRTGRLRKRRSST